MLKKILLALSVVLMLLLAHSPAQAEYGDIVLNKLSEKNDVQPVVFSHWFHRIRYQCQACHTDLGFKMVAGATETSMDDITAGKFCGKCHNGTIAWGASRCDLCHSGKPGLPTGVIGGDKTGGPGHL